MVTIPLRKYELTPTDNRRSFYGKALVYTDGHGAETLYSYGTPILTKDAAGNLFREWHGWSATTGRHIKAFAGLNKAEFLKVPAADELTPAEKATAYTGTLYR